MNILVVEDEAVSHKLICTFLERLGHTVTGVKSAEEGWNLFQKHSFRLIVTDWHLPGMSGLELCRRVRHASRKSSYTYIIILTADDDQLAGLSAGADDSLNKPFHAEDLRYRIECGLRVLDLEDRLITQMELLERSRAELNDAHQRMQANLMAAAELQKTLLPLTFATDEALQFSWLYEPSESMGGDYFNVLKLTDHQYGVLMVDVCGHGVSAALLAVTIHHVTDPRMLHSPLLIADETAPAERRVASPTEVLEQLNRQFPCDDQVSKYFTVFYGVFDARTGRFQYATAGHPTPLLIQADHNIQQMPGSGVPIGLVETPEYEPFSTQLGVGDRLLLLSDGVTESTRPKASVAEQRIRQLANLSYSLPIEQLPPLFFGDLRAGACNTVLADDVSILALEYVRQHGARHRPKMREPAQPLPA